MRPTGRLHLGHLVGVLKNWIDLQKEYECYFMVADFHALLSEYKNPQLIKENSLDNVADWLSWGLDPEKSAIFIQSQIKEHLELFFIFSSFVPLGWLYRCPTFKDQIAQLKDKDINNLGFLGYPVLQAADILIYKAEKVPVGEDQLPHLELTREIARKFNNLYSQEVFPYPQPIMSEQSKLLGLDGRKMSKSYDNCIYLSEKSSDIEKKINTMFTDPERIKRNQPGRPEVCNVFSYYSLFFGQEKPVIYDECTQAKIGCTDCKKKLAKLLENFIALKREFREEIINKKNYLSDVLDFGKKKAEQIAKEVLVQVKEVMQL